MVEFFWPSKMVVLPDFPAFRIIGSSLDPILDVNAVVVWLASGNERFTRIENG